MYIVEGNNVYQRFGEMDIADKVRIAQRDDYAFELLWKDFEDSMRYLAYKKIGRHIDQSCDEWSCIMLAFNEAVNKYDPSKGSFRSFTDMVVSRRLTDFLRGEYRRQDEIPVDVGTAEGNMSEEDEPQQGVLIEFKQAVTAKAWEEDRKRDLRTEIMDLNERLKTYDISFSDLTKVSPKAMKTRRACGAVINLLADHPEMVRKMKTKGTIPSKEICEKINVSPKILENHRKYIIAAVEIATGDYPGLQEYLKTIREEGR